MSEVFMGDWPTVWDVWCRRAPHLSSFSDPLSLMQLAMMMAEATPRFLPERSIFSVGVVPLSSSIRSGWPSTLRAHGRPSVQPGMTLGREAGLPHSLERLISRQVKCQQLRISSIEVST